MTVLIISKAVTVNSPSPFQNNAQNLIEIGSIKVTPADNNPTSAPNTFSKTYTRTVPKMNQFLPNSYSIYLGIRQIDLIFSTASQNNGGFELFKQSSTSSSIDISCKVTNLNKFSVLRINYMLVHQTLKQQKIIFGWNIAFTPGQSFSADLSNSYPVAISIPASGYKIFTSIYHLLFYRDDAVNIYDIFFKFYFTYFNSTQVDLNIDMGNKGNLADIKVLIMLVANELLDPTIKKPLMLSLITYPAGGVANPNFAYSIPFSHEVSDDSFWVGLSYFRWRNQNFRFQVYADSSDKTLKGITYNFNSDLYYQGVSIIGYNCSIGYYFNQQIQQCELCPGLCTKCAIDSLDVLICLECGPNFLIAFNKLKCECTTPGTKLLGSACINFNAVAPPDCVSAIRINGTVQCVTCLTIPFREIKNNMCVCIQGYDDFDEDGQCKQTCGDGLIIQAQCDDGNLINGDGCRSDCFIEPGFVCDKLKPSFCKTLTPLSHKITRIKKLEDNRAQITFEIVNQIYQQPYPVEIVQFQPESTYLQLILIEIENPLKETPLIAEIISLASPYKLTLQFEYTFTIENLKARVVFDYSKTRYLDYIQNIPFTIESSNYPLIYSSNLATYQAVSVTISVWTIAALVGLLFGLFTPKFIGVETLITLQLVFYSQLLIKNPFSWPAGFLYLKYFKLASGYNDFFSFSNYDTLTTTAIKYEHLQIKNSFIQNFNLNFALIAAFFVNFLIVFCIKTWNSRILEKNIELCKANEQVEQFKVSKQLKENTDFWMRQNDRAFWMISNVSLWLILPMVSSISPQLTQTNTTINTFQKTLIVKTFVSLGSFVAFTTISIIFVINLNNFSNIFLSEDTFSKILFRPEERTYKRLLFIYLLLIGSLVLFFNDISIFNIPMSIFVLILQIIYTLTLLVIHPYKQSLRVHSITLIINQCVYIVFLAFINLINLVKDIDEQLIIILGYFITGCCGILMILTAVRLYYELRYGEALERQIQKERQKEEELEKKRKQEKLERKKKQFELEARMKLKQTAKEMERGKNQFLYENQVKQQQGMDLMQWLENKNWEAEEKQKYYFQKFAEKPMEWLKKNEKEEFFQKNKKNQNESLRKQKQENEEYQRTVSRLRKQSNRQMEQWQKKLQKHYIRIQKDASYSMNAKKNQKDIFMQREYELKD